MRSYDWLIFSPHFYYDSFDYSNLYVFVLGPLGSSFTSSCVWACLRSTPRSCQKAILQIFFVWFIFPELFGIRVQKCEEKKKHPFFEKKCRSQCRLSDDFAESFLWVARFWLVKRSQDNLERKRIAKSAENENVAAEKLWRHSGLKKRK